MNNIDEPKPGWLRDNNTHVNPPMNNIDELRNIIADAPNCSEFISNMGYLWNDNDNWFIYAVNKEEWLHLFFHDYDYSDWKIRSLADITTIIEQADRIKDFEANQAKRDLGMKINGINEFANLICGDCTNEYAYYLNEASLKYIDALRKQAGDL